MRLEAMADFWARARTDDSVIRNLVAKARLIEMEFEGLTFCVMRLPREV
jgi:hypothetical protein